MRRLLHLIALFFFHIFVARPILGGFVDVRFRGRNHLPKGPCLVVSNHNSHLDAAILMTMFPLRRLPYVHPVAAADYFGASWWKKAMAMLFMNGVPIERRPTRGVDPLMPVVERLKRGESLIFFPEGSRGEAGVVAQFRRGIGMIVREVPGLLVVPVFLSGPERIWPRGEVVPVPLNIDAHIGQPRAYSVDDDPRRIAEQVRKDVLALAPPPPPVPGQRPAPPLRIAFASIDADARRAAFGAATERLGTVGPTLGVSGEVLEADRDGVRPATAPIPVQRIGFWLKLFTSIFSASSRFRKEEFAGLVQRAQVNEALDHGRDIRFATVESSALIEILAFQRAAPDRGGADEAELNRMLQYLTGGLQIPALRTLGYLRRAPEVWLINTFDLVRPPLPEILVYLRVPPARVIERWRSRGLKMGRYDNLSYLERLDDSYGKVAELLRKRHRVEVLEIEAERIDPQAVATEIESVCRRLAGVEEQGAPSLS